MLLTYVLILKTTKSSFPSTWVQIFRATKLMRTKVKRGCWNSKVQSKTTQHKTREMHGIQHVCLLVSPGTHQGWIGRGEDRNLHLLKPKSCSTSYESTNSRFSCGDKKEKVAENRVGTPKKGISDGIWWGTNFSHFLCFVLLFTPTNIVPYSQKPTSISHHELTLVHNHHHHLNYQSIDKQELFLTDQKIPNTSSLHKI